MNHSDESDAGEARERNRLRAMDKKARQKIHRRVKRPVFIVGAFASFSAWTLRTGDDLTGTDFNVSMVTFALLLGLYYKMLTDSFNWVYGQLQQEDIKKTYRPTRLNNLAIYGLAALLPTIVFAGLYLLIFYVLLERLT